MEVTSPYKDYPELIRIERMVAALRVVTKELLDLPKARSNNGCWISAAELVVADIPPRYIADMAENPFHASLRLAVHHIGQHLHRIGGSSLMEKVFDDVLDGVEGERFQLLADIIDKNFDGIGGWAA